MSFAIRPNASLKAATAARGSILSNENLGGRYYVSTPFLQYGATIEQGISA